MARILIAPGKFIVGRGTVDQLSQYIKPLGVRPLVLITDSGKKRLQDKLANAFADSAVDETYEYFHRECSRKEIDRLVKVVKKKKADLVIGFGGGKLLDTAKAVAYYSNLPVVIVPTIASTDAPCSALSVVYTDEGKFESYLMLPHNPNIVLMDTEVIAKSPIRLTVAGMGDALATYFEARGAGKVNAGVMAGDKQTITGMALAKLCYETLLEEGLKAKAALEKGAITPSVDVLIEATTLLSGLGFESGGLCAAHSIYNGLTTIEAIHKMNHGEVVAFGTVTQLFLEDADQDEIDEVIEFCLAVGLPITFEDLGIADATEEQLLEAAALACAPSEAIHNMTTEITPETVKDAMIAADHYVSQMKAEYL